MANLLSVFILHILIHEFSLFSKKKKARKNENEKRGEKEREREEKRGHDYRSCHEDPQDQMVLTLSSLTQQRCQSLGLAAYVVGI